MRATQRGGGPPPPPSWSGRRAPLPRVCAVVGGTRLSRRLLPTPLRGPLGTERKWRHRAVSVRRVAQGLFWTRGPAESSASIRPPPTRLLQSSRNNLRRAAAEWAQDFHCPPQNLECALPWVAQRRSLVLRRRGRPLGPALPGPVPGDWRPVWVGRSPAGGARGRADTSLGPVSGVRRRPHTPLRRARRRDSDLTLSMAFRVLHRSLKLKRPAHSSLAKHVLARWRGQCPRCGVCWGRPP